MKHILIALIMITILMMSGLALAGDITKAEAASLSGAEAVILSAPNYLQAQPIYPYLLQMVPGVIADVTNNMPIPDVIQPLRIEVDKQGVPLPTNEKYVKVKTFNGWVWDRIRMEDVEEEVISHVPAVMKKFGVKTTERLRYRIGMKMSSRTIGSGGGAGGTVAGFGGGTNPLAYGSNASVMPAVAVNTADPQFVIRYYLVPLAPNKKASLDEEYIKQGWTKVEEKSKKVVFGQEVND